MGLDALIGILIAAGALCAVTESVVQMIKMAFKELTPQKTQLLVVGTSVLLAAVLIEPGTGNISMDIGLKVVAGLLASRGANYVHHFADVVKGYASIMKLKGAVADEVKSAK
jgi:hypothetical protein